MAFSSGVFTRLYNWVVDRDAGTKIRADRMDAEMDGMATALSTCLLKDGTQTVTADIPMATYKFTGVGDAAARNQYLAAGQLQDGEINWVDGGGTADAITTTYVPAPTALVDGMLLGVRATAANATTTPTFKVGSLTAYTIVKNGGVALAAGDIVGDGHELLLRYDLSNTQWELLNPATGGLGAIGTDVQAYDLTLTTIAALTGLTDNAIIRANGSVGAYQDTGWLIDDSDVMTAGGNLDMGANTISGAGFLSSVEMPKNHIAGLQLSTSGGDVLVIAAGEARDIADAEDMTIAAFTKDVSAVWAVGTGNGARIDGAYTADTLYYVYLIKRTDTGVVDIAIGTQGDITLASFPANYDAERLIGAFVTDSTPDILAFSQVGDYFRFTGDVVSEVSDSSITALTYENVALSAPRWSLAQIYIQCDNATTNQDMSIYVRTTGANDAAIVQESVALSRIVGAGSLRESATVPVLCNADSQIGYAASEANGAATITIRTLGFTMMTRSNPI